MAAQRPVAEVDQRLTAVGMKAHLLPHLSTCVGPSLCLVHCHVLPWVAGTHLLAHLLPDAHWLDYAFVLVTIMAVAWHHERHPGSRWTGLRWAVTGLVVFSHALMDLHPLLHEAALGLSLALLVLGLLPERALVEEGVKLNRP